ncbi:MAG: WD40 repeat domain-containing protein [Candidatus Sericytochromatia bacterium]|nr:WD40 repeat domain-containing protein [Candidatus Sericytochromatia bacterium]
MPSLSAAPGWLGAAVTAQAPDAVQDLAWHPSEPRCALGLVGGEWLEWGPEGLVGEVRPAHAEGLLALAWSPLGDRLATAGQDGWVRLWGRDARPLAGLEQGEAWVSSLAWAPDGAWLAVASGRHLEVWDLRGESPRRQGRLGPHASTITAVAWLPKEAGIAVAAYGGVTVWPSPNASPSLWARLRGAEDLQPRHLSFKGSLLALAVSPDGRFYATGNQDGTVHLWYAASGADLEMTGYPTKVRELAWDPRSRFIATGGASSVTLWDMRGRGPAGSRPLVLDAHADFVTAIDCQPAGDLLASAARDGEVMLWRPMRGPDLRGRELQAAVTLGEPAAALRWRPDGRSLLAAGRGGRLLSFAVTR